MGVGLLRNQQAPRGEILKHLSQCDRSLVKLQVSIDGATAETNDRIRGKGSFADATAGLREASRLGFETSLTTAVTATNYDQLLQLTELAKELGAKAQHLMWLHKRGRIIEDANTMFPDVPRLIDEVCAARRIPPGFYRGFASLEFGA